MRIRDALRAMACGDLLELVAFYEDILGVNDDLDRTHRLGKAFGLARGPAWLLSRLAAADGRLFKRDGLIDYLPANDTAHDRADKIVDVQICKVRKAIGADAMETVHGIGWRLTPIGRLRVRRALGEDLKL